MEAEERQANPSGTIGTAVHWLATAFLWLAAAASLLVAVAGTANVVMSFLFNRPIAGVLEVTELALVLIIFMSQPYVYLHGMHISVELVKSEEYYYLKYVKLSATALSAIASFSLISWTGWQSFLASWDTRQKTDGIVAIPVYPIKFALVAAAAATLVAVVYVTARQASSLGRK